MALAIKILRAITIPNQTASANIILKYSKRYISSTCDDDVDDDDDGEGDSHPFVCLYCNQDACCCGTNMYDARKYSFNLPGYTRHPPFPPLLNIPTDIFRCTDGECLGPLGQAAKCGSYQNPEYFSFHHMTYYDAHLSLSSCRNPAPVTGRKL